MESLQKQPDHIWYKYLPEKEDSEPKEDSDKKRTSVGDVSFDDDESEKKRQKL